jgi:hypothetical protein
MVTKKAKETGFITAANFVTVLRGHIRTAKDEDTISVREIRVTLNRVLLPGEANSESVEAAALTRIGEYMDNNPDAEGMSAAHLWRDLMGQGMLVGLDAVDAALANLVEAGKIEKNAGQISTFSPIAEETEIKT